MDFTFVPHHIQPGPPKYNTLLTQLEGMRKKARLLSSLPMKTWELVFRGQSLSERDAIKSHYENQQGSTIPFNWTSVPDYVDSTSSYYVRYTESDGYSDQLIMQNCFEVTVHFELAL